MPGVPCFAVVNVAQSWVSWLLRTVLGLTLVFRVKGTVFLEKSLHLHNRCKFIQPIKILFSFKINLRILQSWAFHFWIPVIWVHLTLTGNRRQGAGARQRLEVLCVPGKGERKWTRAAVALLCFFFSSLAIGWASRSLKESRCQKPVCCAERL